MKRNAWLVAVLSFLLLLTPSLAQAGTIVGSYHDMTFINEKHQWRPEPDFLIEIDVINNYNEICVYCHTPHNATVEVPLWNRELAAVTYTPYSSGSMTTQPGQPSHYSLLCLSCHDGTLAIDAIANYNPATAELLDYPDPHGSMNAGPGYLTHTDCYSCHRGNTTFPDFTPSFLTTDLSNDHPISMTYPESAKYHIPLDSGNFANSIRLIDGKVECSTCHNVHDPDIKPFLRTSNAGSELCLTCHVK